MDKKDLCEHTRIRLIAAAVGHQQCTKTESTLIPLPGTPKFIAIGTLPAIAKVLMVEPPASIPPSTTPAPQTAWNPLPVPEGVAFYAYHPSLVHPDFNPWGVVEAAHDGEKVVGAVWNGVHDCWDTLPIEVELWKHITGPLEAVPVGTTTVLDGQVAHEGSDGLMRIHDESAKCDVCAPAPQTDELAQLRNRVSELEAARIAYASEFPLTADGDPDVGNIHANIRALKAAQAAPSAPTDRELKGKTVAGWYVAYCEVSAKLKEAEACIGRYEKLVASKAAPSAKAEPVAYMWLEDRITPDSHLGPGEHDDEVCFDTEPPIEGTTYTPLYDHPAPAVQAEDVRNQAADEDRQLLDFVESECVTLQCYNIPYQDDADVAFKVIQYHMAKPHEREIGFGSTPRAALRDAIRYLAAPSTSQTSEGESE